MEDVYLEWKESFATDNPLIDKQNEGLYIHINGYLDRLKYIVRDEPRREVLLEILNSSLRIMTENHSVERELYEAHGYPMAKVHTTEHQNLRNYFTALKSKVESGKKLDETKQLKAISSLFGSHFSIYDQGLAEFLKTRNDG